MMMTTTMMMGWHAVGEKQIDLYASHCVGNYLMISSVV